MTPGNLLADRYRLDERIAVGGMGEVWQATDTVLARQVAVKVVRARAARDPAVQARFRREAQAMAALSHPGIVDVYDYGAASDGHVAYLVMTHVAGQPLDEKLAAAGRLDPAETMSIVATAARALHAAHDAGIVHRDVKPANLLVQDDGTVVLVDFGVAQSVDATSLTGINEFVGTAAYIAPEQVTKQPAGPATDVYALGVVAYQCLAGHPPFLGDNAVTVATRHLQDEPPPLPADVPAPVRELITTAMAKDPADRFPTAAAMAEAAETAIRPVPPPAEIRPAVVRAEERTVAIRRPDIRRWLPAFLAGLLALTALGFVLALTRPTAHLPAPDGPSGSPGPRPAQPSAPAGSPGQPGAPPRDPGGGGPTVTVPGLPPSLPEPTLPEPSPPAPSLPGQSVPAEPSPPAAPSLPGIPQTRGVAYPAPG